MADSAEEAFKQLSDTHTRFDFFKRILPSLTSQDVRNLRSALSACTLQFDIAGSLPTELFVEVFKYLDTHDAIRLEFVCKRWNALLSNPALLQQILGTDIASPKAPLRNEPANMTSSVLRRRRERRRALRVCEPVWLGRYTRSAKYGRWNVAAKKVDFCQGVIAAILPHDGSRSTGDVEIIDLCSGNNHRVRGDASSLVLKSCICGWTDYVYVYTQRRVLHMSQCIAHGQNTYLKADE